MGKRGVVKEGVTAEEVLKWSGHMERMTKKAYKSEEEETRNWGKSRRRWKDRVKDTLKAQG